MPDILRTFDDLFIEANLGEEVLGRDLWVPRLSNRPHMTEVVGKGLDFYESPFIQGPDGHKPILGHIALRVAALRWPRKEDRLINLRTMLSWHVSTDGYTEMYSTAIGYMLPRVSLVEDGGHGPLDLLERYQEEHMGMTVAGAPIAMTAEQKVAMRAHHTEMINAAKADEPDLLCMVGTDTLDGESVGDHLVRLLRWIKNQPRNS